MEGKRTKVAVVNENECVACGACMKVCKKGAIIVRNGLYAVVDEAVCIGCGWCMRKCPASVIHIRTEIKAGGRGE